MFDATFRIFWTFVRFLTTFHHLPHLISPQKFPQSDFYTYCMLLCKFNPREGGMNLFQSGKYLQSSKCPFSKTHLSLEIYFLIKTTHIIGWEGHSFCANKIESRLVTLKPQNYRWKRSSWVRNHRSCRTTGAVCFTQVRPLTVSSPD